jgi:hypothetical protein
MLVTELTDSVVVGSESVNRDVVGTLGVENHGTSSRLDTGESPNQNGTAPVFRNRGEFIIASTLNG